MATIRTLTARQHAAAYALPTDTAEDEVITQALAILARRVRRTVCFDTPKVVRDFLAVRMSSLDCEVFAVVFLDTQLRLIEAVDMFRGTISQTSVYPREIIKTALRLNASAVILAHNHPSGCAEPSRADEFLTQSLKTALATIDVRVLDHIVVAGGQTVSFAERGLL